MAGLVSLDSQMHTEYMRREAYAKMDAVRKACNEMLETLDNAPPERKLAVLRVIAAVPEKQYRKWIQILRYSNDEVFWYL